MFDKSRLPPGSELLQDVDSTNKAIADMRSMLRDTVPLGTDMVTMLPELAECFFQAQVRRALQFLDGGIHALDSGHGLVALMCARSLYESAACLKDFSDRACKLIEKHDFAEAAQFMIGRTLAMRFQFEHLKALEPQYKAVNVLSQLDAIEKYVPNARQTYEKLSETAHPNALGAFIYFELETNDKFVHFGNGENGQAVYGILVGTASLFRLMRDAHLQIMAGSLDAVAHELQERIDHYKRRKSE